MRATTSFVHRVVLAAFAWALVPAAHPAAAQQPCAVLERVGGITNSPTYRDMSRVREPASPSGDGRYVAFASDLSTLVPGDTNGQFDVFVYDRETGVTERVSVASDGTQGNLASMAPRISGDGRYVAFESDANTLVPGDTNGQFDVFVHDRQTGVTERASVASDGTEGIGWSRAAALSADGRYVAFQSIAGNLVPGDTNTCYPGSCVDVFVHDRQTEVTERVSVATDGTEGNRESGNASLSADGRFVAFESVATTLVPGDTNGLADVFVHDRQTGVTERVSEAFDGTQANGESERAHLSADGRYVAFASRARNLVPGDTNMRGDVFVYDRETGVMEWVSVASDGAVANDDSGWPSLSGDGRYVTFVSGADNLAPDDRNWTDDLFVHDRGTGLTQLLSMPMDGAQQMYSDAAALSADGRYVALTGRSLIVPLRTADYEVFVAANCLATPGTASVWWRTRPTAYFVSGMALPVEWELRAAGPVSGHQVHLKLNGVPVESSPVLGGANGVYSFTFTAPPVAGSTYYTVVVEAVEAGAPIRSPALPLEVRPDVQQPCAVLERVSVASDGAQGDWSSFDASLSADGRFVAFTSIADNLVPGDTNGWQDVFVHDRETGSTERVSVASDGAQGNHDSWEGSLSADGRYVAFRSFARNLVPGNMGMVPHFFVRDRQTGMTEMVSDVGQGLGPPGRARLSADGRYVAFSSDAVTVVPGDTNDTYDVFVRDRRTGTTERVSVPSDGTQGDYASVVPSISADGRYVAFESSATNLVPGDTNACPYRCPDVFVHDRQTGTTERVSVASDGTQGNSSSGSPSVSADGRYVAFSSTADNLVLGDTNDTYDVFVHDRQTGTTERVSVAADGTEGNGWSWRAALSADGRFVAFQSWANNLVPGDTNGWEDVFVHDRQTGVSVRVSVAADGTQCHGEFGYVGVHEEVSLSRDGRVVAFVSKASNLVPGDTSVMSDVFVADNCLADPPGARIRWRTPPPGQVETGTPVFVEWTLTDFTGAITENQVQLSLNGAVVASSPVQAAANGTYSHTFTAPAVSQSTTYTVVARALEDGVEVLSPPASVAVVAASIAWVTPPPATAVGGDSLFLEWELTGFGGPITEHQAHFGIRSVLGSSEEKPGATGVHTHTFAAPNVGNYDSPTTFHYIIRALDDAAQVLSPVATTVVQTGPHRPRVIWLTPPPLTVESGQAFTVEWQVSDFVDPPVANQVGWGLTSILGHSPSQPGGNGTYTATVTAPLVQAAGTLLYVAYAENPIEFAASALYPVQVNPAPPVPATDYFPLTPGSTWTYRLDGVLTHDVTVQPGTVDVNGRPTTVFAWSNGRERMWTADATGIFFHREVFTDTAATFTYDPPFQTAPGLVAIGATVTSSGTFTGENLPGQPGPVTGPYTASFTVEAFEPVTVPAGMYDTVRLRGTVEVPGFQTRTVRTWAAPGIGLVKVLDSGDPTRELVSTNLP